MPFSSAIKFEIIYDSFIPTNVMGTEISAVKQITANEFQINVRNVGVGSTVKYVTDGSSFME